MNVQRTPHEWSKEALFLKAQRYAQAMVEAESNSDWKYALWSTFTLEMLIRCSISNISPTLIADGKSWYNILYAVGKTPNQKKYIPRSLDIATLLDKAEGLFEGFTLEMQNFCISHIQKRNSELHSGDLPFDNLGSSKWVPMFFLVCKVLLEEMGESLGSFFGKPIEKEVNGYIDAFKEENIKYTNNLINAHKTIWSNKSDDEKKTLSEQAKLIVTRNLGHRVICPSCSSSALIRGEPVGSSFTQTSEDGIIEKQKMRPSVFECSACGLKIVGYSKLVVCDLGDCYTSTNTYDAKEYFGIDIEEEYYNMMEDNNEP